MFTDSRSEASPRLYFHICVTERSKLKKAIAPFSPDIQLDKMAKGHWIQSSRNRVKGADIGRSWAGLCVSGTASTLFMVQCFTGGEGTRPFGTF